MGRTIKAPDERKQEILDCAYELFSTKGFKKMQMKDISKTLDIAHGLVYHYFKSKDDLFDAVITRLFEDRMGEYVKIANSDLSPKEKLAEIFKLFSQRGEAQAIIEAFHAEENEMLRHKVRFIKIHFMTPILTEIIQEGCERGEFTARYPEETAHFLLHGELGIKASQTGPVEGLPTILKHFYEQLLGTEI